MNRNPYPTPHPLTDPSIAALARGFEWSGTLYPMGHALTVSDAVNALTRAAVRLAPRVANSALDSAMTDTLPRTAGPRAARARDMVALGFVLNAMTDRTDAEGWPWRDRLALFGLTPDPWTVAPVTLDSDRAGARARLARLTQDTPRQDW